MRGQVRRDARTDEERREDRGGETRGEVTGDGRTGEERRENV